MNNPGVRSFKDGDDKLFAPHNIAELKIAQAELRFLLDRDYPPKSAGAYVGNHHQLSVRQRLALSRCTASSHRLKIREEKMLSAKIINGRTVYVDGFNQIIVLEVALSGGMLFIGQDGCIRDLAELRGSYRLIPVTGTAIELIRNSLLELRAAKAVFLLDEPVSNSGRLKTLIMNAGWPIPAEVRIVKSPDSELKRLHCVITGDSAILDACKSWFNLTAYILRESRGYKNLPAPIDLSNLIDLQ